jgi:hypothetical protein
MKKTKNKNKCAIHDVNQSLPTYEELVYALKDTHNLYVEAIKDEYMTHDITRLMSNENIFKRIEKNNH